ncbi:MAG: primosomal protein N', partial [Burkholderiaceae bacterium]
MERRIVKVALDTPLDTAFDYRWIKSDDAEPIPQVGQFVLVPFGRREVVGLILAVQEASDLAEDKIRDVIAVRSQLAPLSSKWLELCYFAADYYQRPVGEVVIPCSPKNLRALKNTALDKAIKKIAKLKAPALATASVRPQLHDEQEQAVLALEADTGFSVNLLFGVTGSGKTEVYLQAAERILDRARLAGEAAQVLILVPEINLTPQLEGNIRARFPHLQLATLHSQLAEGERLLNWMAAHTGNADIVLGTRLAVLASMPHLKLIVIDEEHDPSYKQQEGLRYSARDLGIWRAHQLNIAVVLGSATPSMESWQHAATGRYHKLELTRRAASNAQLPRVSLIDMERNKAPDGLAEPLITAIKLRLEKGEQSLLFLNRRGYAPVIHCDACGWISNCRRCTAFMVLHKPERRLRCHHCSLELRIPNACPTCGNVDLQPLGRGTQRVEETLQKMFPDARVLRIDADSTRKKGSAQEAFDSVHRGDVDILLGTQMVAKGHDFQRLTLVGAINPDTALFSQDYR